MKDAWKGKSHHEFLEKGLARHLHAERLKLVRSSIASVLDRRNRGSTATIIDLGCGDGVLTSSIGMDGLRVVGTDLDLDRIKKARSSSADGWVYAVSNALAAPFMADSADMILTHHVIEHLAGADEAILRECFRILKPGGTLILGVPNEDSFLGRFSRMLHPKLYMRGEHVNFYSERSIAALTTVCGFRVKDVYRIGFLFPVYYMHMAIISIKPLFLLGHYLTGIFKKTADSLLLICEKPTA